MKCEKCKFYEFESGKRHCVWFETRIIRTFPAWKERFENGEIKFRACGFYTPQQ